MWCIHLSLTKEGGKVDGRVGKCAHTPSKSTNTRNHIPANAFHIWPRGRTEQTRRRKSNGNALFWPESTYVYPQMSAHPESTEWSYEHITLEHKHFHPKGSCHIQVLILENCRDYGWWISCGYFHLSICRITSHAIIRVGRYNRIWGLNIQINIEMGMELCRNLSDLRSVVF